MFNPLIDVNPPTQPVDREPVGAAFVEINLVLNTPSPPAELNSHWNRNERNGSDANVEYVPIFVFGMFIYLLYATVTVVLPLN